MRVGEVGIRLVPESDDLALAAAGRSADFLGEPRDGDLRLDVGWRDLNATPAGRKLFDSGASWDLHESDGGFAFRFFSSNLGPRPYRVAWLDRDFSRGHVHLHGPFFDTTKPVDALEYPLDELLVVYLLSRGAGIELHACGVRDENGAGYLFAGQSGDGKTTIARFWAGREGVTVLSDDRIVLRTDGGGPFLHGTPWHGEARLAANATAPARAIFFLDRGERNEAFAVSGAEAMALLLARSFLPFHVRSRIDETLAFCAKLLRAVPCFRLKVFPDEKVVDCVRSLAA